MFQAFNFYLIIVTSLLSAQIYANWNDGGACSEPRGECLFQTTRDKTDSGVTFTVECDCKFPEAREVAQRLHYLSNYTRCPLIPWEEGDEIVQNSVLLMHNCNVANAEFPLSILRSLRRSRTLTINVTGADTMRLPSDSSFVEGGAVPATIRANITKSHLSSLGEGWLSRARRVDLFVDQSEIGVIESGFISNHPKEAEVNLHIVNSNITTISKFAFRHPPEGNTEIKGGKIGKIEEKSFQGGQSLVFEALKIGNIETNAINIFGVKQFKMEACIIAQIQRNALRDSAISGRSLNSEGEEIEASAEVIISKNKLPKIDGDAFEGLCREKQLKFTDNIINVVNPPLKLKKKQCSFNRDWKESIQNNGFIKCGSCDGILNDLDQQVCTLYISGYCLCEPVQFFHTVNATNTEYNIPDDRVCKTTFSEHLTKTCRAEGQQLRKKCSQILTADGQIGLALKFSGAEIESINYLVFSISFLSMMTFSSLLMR